MLRMLDSMMALKRTANVFQWKRSIFLLRLVWLCGLAASDAAFAALPMVSAATAPPEDGRTYSPPFISAIGDQTADEDSPSGVVSLLYGDAETPVDQLRISASSSNPILVPDQNVLFNSEIPLSLIIVPSENQSGAAIITIRVTDAHGASAEQSFRFTVNPVNDSPVLSGVSSITVLEDSEPLSLTFRVSDVESTPETLELAVESQDSLLLPPRNISLSGTGESRSLTFSPASDQTGTATVLLHVRDPDGARSTHELTIQIAPVNDPPRLSRIPDQRIGVNQAIDPVSFIVTDDETPSNEIIVQGHSSNPLLVPDGTILFGGSGDRRTVSIKPTRGIAGTASITIRAYDRERFESSTSFQLIVEPPTPPPPPDPGESSGEQPPPTSRTRPTALAVSVDLLEDTAANVRLNGISAEHRSLTFTIVASPQNGILSGNPPDLVYRPNPNFAGTDSFQYKVSDGLQESLSATVTLVIQDVNDPPTLSSVAARTIEPGKSTGPIRFIVDDFETEPDSLVVSARSSNSELVPDENLSLTGAGRLREMTAFPIAGRTGTTSITLTVSDATGLSASTAFDLQVAAAAGTLTEETQSVVTIEDVPIAVALRIRDTEGRSLAYTPGDPPTKGILSGVAPNLIYRPGLNQTGQDRFTFRTSNGAGQSSAATIEVLILPVNDPPTALSHTHTTREDTPLDLQLAGSDPDGEPISFNVFSRPTKGKLSGTPPHLKYSPNSNETGDDQFVFTVSDGELTSPPAIVRIMIEPVNDAPVALGMVVSALEDAALPIRLIAADPDGDAVVFSIDIPPAKGTLIGSPPDLIYLAHPHTTGVDRFTYRVSDGQESSGPAVVTIMIAAVNDPPIAESRFISVAEDTTAEIVLAGRDVDGDPLSFVIIEPPIHGTLSGNPPQLTYKPAGNFNGTDTLVFRVNDGSIDSQPATVTIAVRPVNDPPSALDQFVTMLEDSSQGITLSGRDVDSDSLLFTVVANPRHGALSGVPPNVTYTPEANHSGSDSFTFRVSDGELESSPATVNITIRGVNDPPVARAQFVAASPGQPRLITLSGADPENDPLQFILVNLPAKGSLSGTPPDLIYVPFPDERGLDSFSFSATDGLLESKPAVIQISLNEKTSGPNISAIPDQTSKNGAPTPQLPFSISDRETAAEKLIIVASSSAPELIPAENIAIGGAGGNRWVKATPLPGLVGSATITLIVWDLDGLAASTRFTITVTRENETPTAEPQSLVTREDEPLNILLEGRDPEDNLLTYKIEQPPAKGTLSGTAPHLIYTPNPNEFGRDRFTFKVNDGQIQSSPASVDIDILPINDPPSISAIADQTFELPDGIPPISYTVDDVDTSIATLTTSIKSSNPTLLDPTRSTITGSGADRILTIAPAAGQFGAGTIVVTVSDGELTAQSEFQLKIIKPNEAPTVNLIEPRDLTVISPQDLQIVRADATDPDGTIRRVEFYAGQELIGIDETAPYEIPWPKETRGEYLVFAKAFDDRNGTATSAISKVLSALPVGRAAILSSADDADLALARKYLFEQSMQSFLFEPGVEDESVPSCDLVIWHQSSGSRLESSQLNLLEHFVSENKPIYFLGDSLLAGARNLSAIDQQRWQNLVHLKPGGTAWVNQVSIFTESDHPIVNSAASGSVTSFGYRVTPQLAAIQTRNSGETVLGRCGDFAVLIASAQPDTGLRTFTHHLRLSQSIDASGIQEQARLFKNAVWWLMNKSSFMDLSIRIEAANLTISPREVFELRIVVEHSGEHAAENVTVTYRIPNSVQFQRAEAPGSAWRESNGSVMFRLGAMTSGEAREFRLYMLAPSSGEFTHSAFIEASMPDANPRNNFIEGIIHAAGPESSRQDLNIQRLSPDRIVLRFSDSFTKTHHSIEFSTNLRNWEPHPPAPASTANSVEISTQQNSQRFFRIVPIK